MQWIKRCALLLIIGLLACSNIVLAQAATIYLPVINKGYTLFNDAVSAIDPKAQSGAFQTPLDATLDPEAKKIYFTATSAHGAGVFSVPADGGAVVSITVGAPFTVPIGLAMGSNGQTIYVADSSTPVTTTQRTASGANQVRLPPTRGAIFSLPITGGAPKVIAGTGGMVPRGLEVAEENGVDQLYFTGIDPSDNQPALFKIPASGGALIVIRKGAPFVSPVGVAIAKDGTFYVTDDAATGNGLGTLFRLKGGKVDSLADHLKMGVPAGVALTLDESLLLVSALDANFGTSQVFVINLNNQQQGIVTKVVSANHGSGGLHRARNQNSMAWCGTTGPEPSTGTVYHIKLN